MITPEIIQEVTRRLVAVYNPVEIYLFGSYAWGKPDEDSDLDLLIVVEGSADVRHRRSIPGSRSLRGMMVPKDIMVYTIKEFDRSSADQSSICYKIRRQGKVLYARA